MEHETSPWPSPTGNPRAKRHGNRRLIHGTLQPGRLVDEALNGSHFVRGTNLILDVAGVIFPGISRSEVQSWLFL